MIVKEAGLESFLGLLKPIGQSLMGKGVAGAAENVAAKALLKTVGTHAAVGAVMGGGGEAMRDIGNFM